MVLTNMNNLQFPSRILPWCLLACWTLIFFPTIGWADEALDHFNRAHQLVQQGQHEQAVTTLETAIKAYPNFAEAHHLLGLVYFTGLQNSQKAIAALQHAISDYPNFARAHMDLGTVLHHQKNHADAEAAYLQALTLYPRFQEAQRAIANLYDHTQQAQKAIHAFTKVLTFNPDQADVLYKLAYWYRKAGNAQQAHITLDRLHDTQPTHLAGWLLRGDMAEQEDKPKVAIEAYEKALASNNELLDPHYALGFLYQEQGQSQKAATHFTKVVTLAPQNPEAHLNLGVVLASLKQLDEAEQAYQTAISLDPTLLDAYYNLGVFYEFHRKDTDKALAQYREYLKRGGTDDRITKLIKKIEK